MDNMEKRIQKISFRKHIHGIRRVVFCAVYALYSFFSTSFIFAQNIPSSDLLRFPLWFPSENVPVVQKPLQAGDSVYTQAVEEIRVLAPFMLEGLIYGWRFVYTPSDKLRGVDEFFSMEAVIPIASDERLSFTNVRRMDEHSRLECWVEYRLAPDMVYRRERLKTTRYRKIQGIGEAPLIGGSEGVKQACREALKDAVRSYARAFVKNKPKEISGTVLLTDFPRYYIKSGKYRADLDFFLFVSKIEEYTQF